MTFEGVYSLIADQPSKCLYNIVAECIASVTLNDPAMHLCAAATNPDFKIYAETVCSNAAIIADYTLSRLFDVQIVPASAVVTAAQSNAARRCTGAAALETYVCRSCTLVHVPITAASRASKVKLGVSVNLTTLEMQCNNCGCGAPELCQLTGHFITGTVRGRAATATCCTGCGLAAVDPVYRGEHPMCRKCASQVAAPSCLCGTAAAVGGATFMAGSGRDVRHYAA
eukprot:gene25963-15464_t